MSMDEARSAAASMRAAEAVVNGTHPIKCTTRTLHVDYADGSEHDLPLATYVMYCSPCETEGCVGAVVCVGHVICLRCCATIRADLVQWKASKNDVVIHFVRGRSAPQPAAAR